MKFKVLSCVALMALSVAACGDDSDGKRRIGTSGRGAADPSGRGTSRDSDAKEKCGVYVEAACESLVACIDGDDDDFTSCLEETEDLCDDAVSVTRNFEACIDELESDRCAPDLDIPAICNGVILTE